MSQQYEDKDPLEDKRDEKFIQIRSNTYFYEMFKKKTQKSDEIIPTTILWEAANPNAWFFNSTKAKTPTILHKNADKVNVFEICKYLLGISRPEELRIDNLSALSEHSRRLSQVINRSRMNPQQLFTTPVCFLRYLDKRTAALTGSELVKLFIEGKQSANIQMIQSFIPNNSKANEMYYVEYRHDDITLPLGFKFYKKTLSTKKGYMTPSEQNYNLENKESLNGNSITMNSTSGPNGNSSNKKEILKGKKLFFKCFDNSLNQRLQENTKRLIEFIERAYKFKIRKFTPKFMLDMKGSIVFLGLKHLYIELFSYAPYDIDMIKENKSLTFTEFRKLAKQSKKTAQVKIGGVQMRLPSVIHQDDKKYSATLYKKMRVEKCGGDFCDYEMLEKNSGPLAMRKNILEEYKKHFGIRKEQLENIAVNLPYEISNQLILRTREHGLSVVDILLKNKIFSKESQVVKSSNYHYSNEDNFSSVDVDVEYPFIHKPFSADNYENLYKRIKICKSCFIIYSLTAKHFDEKLKESLKQQSQFNRTSSMKGLTRRPHTTQFTPNNTNGFGFDSIQEKPPRNSATASATMQQLLEKSNNNNGLEQSAAATGTAGAPRELMKSQTSALLLPPKKSIRIASQRNISTSNLKLASESTRANNMQEDFPETFSVSSKPPKPKLLLPNTRKDIEVNRLTLGFLNYEKLKNLYKEPVDPPKDQHGESQEIKPQKKQINLLEKPYRDLKRKDINADSYLLFKIAEDRKNLRRNISTDSLMRQALLNKLTSAQQTGQAPSLIQLNSLYYNHTNFQHLRRIHKYKLSSPINPYFEDLDVSRIQGIDLARVCDHMGYPDPYIQTDDLEFLVIDESTAIPFVLLGSQPTDRENGSNEVQAQPPPQHPEQNPNDPLHDSPFATNSGSRQKHHNTYSSSANPTPRIEPTEEVIVFLQDFFDSFMEYRLIFEDMVAQNPRRKVLLLNLPGQAYSIFNSDLLYPNYYQIEVIDRLLFKLDSEKRINTKTNKFKFIGIGYGGFILQSFMVSAYGNLPHLGSLLLLNSFIEVDNILKDTLLKSLEIFETCPEDMSDLSYNYFSVIVNSQALTEDLLQLKMKMNPILNDGRCTIIRGCLASQFMRDRFEKVPISCQIVHTLKNCVVNINQSDLLAKFSKAEQEDYQANLILKKASEKKVVRTTKYINGGHSLLEEDVPRLVELINEFITTEI